MNHCVQINLPHIIYKMNRFAKFYIFTVLIYIIIVFNIEFLKDFKNNFMIEHFDNAKFTEKKNRCLRYFDKKEYNKYGDFSCSNYEKDYHIFQNEKNKYMSMFMCYNIVITVFMILIYIII